MYIENFQVILRNPAENGTALVYYHIYIIQLKNLLDL